MTARILHVSDLHVGAGEGGEAADGLAALVERTEPELVVASGDLSHRARADQLEEAARFLHGLGRPVLAVPGNHDIPWSAARLTKPFAAFDRVFGEREPVHASAALHVVGLNSVRPWRHQSGGLRESQLAAAAARLGEAAPAALRVVVLHHHLLGAPWRSRKKPVARRGQVLRSLVDAGAELILSGHVHQAAVGERHEFEVVDGARASVVAIAPGLGQPRPNRLGEARGLQIYAAGERTLTVSTYIWHGGGWSPAAERVFPRGLEPLQSSP